ncbi:MAG: hypothetical protein ACE5KP_00580 [Dehalococcoidales bacterium]
MTHTLHRSGTRESLSGDYVFLFMPAFGINSANCGPKLRKFLEITLRYNPVNIGDTKRGNMYSLDVQNILDNVNKDGTVVHAVFDNEKVAAEALKELKEADLGLSLVVSGIFDRVKEHCQKAGIHRHAVTYSLGIWGKTEKLPPEQSLDIITMCGHGMVSAALIDSLAEEVKAGRKSTDDAVKEMAKQCDCGIFNTTRAAKLLTALIEAK